MDEEKKKVDFRGLRGWKESIVLAEVLEPVFDTITGPGRSRIIDQLVTACDSVHSNIAEGYAKGPCPDRIRFFKIAHASACEIETRLEGLMARRRVNPGLARIAVIQAQRARSQIWGFIKWDEACQRDMERKRKAG